MNIRLMLISLVSLLLALSLWQMLPLPPHGGQVYPLYRSGYFNELEQQFAVIAESFLAIKTMSKPVYGWIFLQDLERKHHIKVTVYDAQGREVKSPHTAERIMDREVSVLLSDPDFTGKGSVDGTFFHYIMPIRYDKQCGFCHKTEKGLAGALAFRRTYESRIYYSRERIILFLAFSILLVTLLFALIRWNPEKQVNKLFDKN